MYTYVHVKFQVGFAGGGGGVNQAATSIQNDDIPLPFVIILLLQFLSMLVDRSGDNTMYFIFKC